MIIEDRVESNPFLHEYPTDHPLVRRMLGLKVGDEFVLAMSNLHNRTAKVKEIRGKYLHRALESVDQWQIMFPQDSGYEKVRFSEVATENGGTRPDFAPIFNSLDRRDEAIRRAEAEYKSLPLTIHVFACRLLTSTIFEAMNHLAWKSGLSLFCCPGDRESFEKMSALVREGYTLVVDLTALQTLVMLGMEGLLRTWSPRVIVPQAVLREIVAYAEKCEFQERDGLMMAKGDDGYTSTKIDPEARRKHYARYLELLKEIRDVCVIRDGRELAKLAPERRDEIIGCVGRHGAEAVLLAARHGHILWTDDHRSAMLGESGFQIKRVWTQAVLQAFAAEHKLSEEALNEASAKLIAWEYSGIRFGAPTIIQAGNLADWDVDRWPFRQVLDQFASLTTNLPEMIWIAASTLGLLHRYVDSAVTRDIIIIRIVARLESCPVGSIAVHKLIELIPKFFRLNPIREMETIAAVRGCLITRQDLMRRA